MPDLILPKNSLLHSLLKRAFLQLEHTRLLLTAHLPPRIQEGDKTWSDLGETLSPAQWKEMVSLLAPNPKKEGESAMSLSPPMGFVSLEEESLESIGFHFHLSSWGQGFPQLTEKGPNSYPSVPPVPLTPFVPPASSVASISFKAPLPLQKKLSSSPPILPLPDKSSPAFHFLVGPEHSGKSSFMLYRLQKFNRESKMDIRILSETPQYNLLSQHCVFHSFLWNEIKKQQKAFFSSSLTPWMEPSSLIVIDAPLEKKLLEQSLLMVEKGKPIYWIVDSLSIESFLRQLHSLCGSASHPMYSYVLSLTHSFTGQRALFNSQGDLLLAHEVLLMTEEVKKNLLQEKGKSPFTFMEEGEKRNNGMQTLNQSLLEHLLARRLSLKEAFQLSRDPENLNRLLEAKGI